MFETRLQFNSAIVADSEKTAVSEEDQHGQNVISSYKQTWIVIF